ncbi:MAG: rRNA pseudouridine synthase [Bacteroidetes bacterium]|nr:rRNA pseudouridine synthase [Bacteroidota bacterium]
MPRANRRYRPSEKRSGRAGPDHKRGKAPTVEYTSDKIRLNRFIAKAGVCSRRDADKLITEGRVSVNSQVVRTLGVQISTKDNVSVNGRRIVPAHHVYLLMNKPSDTITTTSDEKGRQSVLDLIKNPDLKKVGLFPVGRLDRHTTGLLLITNDGTLAHRLMHPSYEIEKLYRVTMKEPLTDEILDKLRTGVELDEGMATVDRVEFIQGKDRREVGISIHEGRNRQVRRMFEALGREVHKLERVRYAGLSATGIRRGKWRRLKRQEVAGLYKLVKL